MNWFKRLFASIGKVEKAAVFRAIIYYAGAFVGTLIATPGLQQYYAFLVALVAIILIHVIMIWVRLKDCTLIQGPQVRPETTMLRR